MMDGREETGISPRLYRPSWRALAVERALIPTQISEKPFLFELSRVRIEQVGRSESVKGEQG